MEAITLIAANILLLLIMAAGVCIERRVTRLELTRHKEAERARELRREVEQLKRRVADAEEDDSAGADRWREKDAERRFTEGVASILGYGLRAVGKEKEFGESNGA